jgi:NADH dehydrogenase [ubiquinone] 1 alpha subcomplex assembly factor 6
MTLESLTNHAESTSSTVLYLLLSILKLSTSNVSHAASHLGIAQTLSTLLRALPFHISKARMVIPAEITAKHDVMQEDVFRKGAEGGGKALEDAVWEFATAANDHLNTARDCFKDSRSIVPKAGMPIFLTGVLSFSPL